MDTLTLATWALAGWCGTVPLYLQIRLIRRWDPNPPPPPEPYLRNLLLLELGLGLAGGLLGGYAFSQAGLEGGTFAVVDLAATSLGAALGGNLLSRIGFAVRG